MPKVTRVEVQRDGKTRATYTEGSETDMHNAAWAYILKHQGQSVDWAMRYEGYAIVEFCDEGEEK